MLILEIFAITSAVSTVATGAYKIVVAIRSNKYAASYARIHELNAHERGKFSEIVIPKRAVIEGHTHGDSAACRSAGSSACATYALANNRIPFYVEMSASDQRAERDGNRTMHWAKDFNAERRTNKPTKDSMLVMIDVDEHIKDLPGYLHKHYLPTIMYTFQPSAAAGVFQDYQYTFTEDNKLKYRVAGGGDYFHQVWNYGADTLVMRKKFLGLTYAKSFFTVEKRYVDENHQVVLLTPLAKFGLLGCILSYNVEGVDLQRLEPVQDGFIRLDISRSKVGTVGYEHLTSTAKVNTHNAATIDVRLDNAIAAVARTSAEKLNLFQIKSAIPEIEHAAALSLLEYHRLKKTKAHPRVVVPTDAVNNYTYNPTPFIDEKPSEVPFMAPLIPECYAPTVSLQNEEAMIKGRITDLKKPEDHLRENEMKYAFEFCELLKKDVGECEPFDFEQINAKLKKPSQRRITEDAAMCDEISDIIKSFMKKEAYQKTATPRPIATINGKVKVEYSAFTYAVAEALKKTSWYAFGRKPKELATRVSAICQLAKHVINTDLSRFDGRVNKSSRQLEEMVMTTLFPVKYHKKMLELMRKQYGKKGVTRLGVKYKNGFNRQSGSPETAILNTILNAFMAYVCLREGGCEPEEAYAKLGVYGGDDGLTPDVAPKSYTEVCARFGHVLEAEVIKRGKSGVTFLSRLYSPSVWFGSPSSCADIARAASKIHVSPASDVSAVDKLFEKCYALSLTDSDTPIIGPFVQRVVEVSGKSASDYKNVLNIWNSETEKDDQYPNDNHDDWMHEVLVNQKLEGFDDLRFQSWLNECTTMEQLLCCPSFIDQQPIKRADVPTKINGDLYESAQTFEEYLKLAMAKKAARDAAINNPPFEQNTQINPPDASRNMAPTSTPASTPITTPPPPYGMYGSRVRTRADMPILGRPAVVRGSMGAPTTGCPVDIAADAGTKADVGSADGRSGADAGAAGAGQCGTVGTGGNTDVGKDTKHPSAKLPRDRSKGKSSVQNGSATNTGPGKLCKFGDGCKYKSTCKFGHGLVSGVAYKPIPNVAVMADMACNAILVAMRMFSANVDGDLSVGEFLNKPAIDFAGAVGDLASRASHVLSDDTWVNIEKSLEHTANYDINSSETLKWLTAQLDPLVSYFSPEVKPSINGNNGSATNTDDHAARPTKGPMNALKQEIKKDVKAAVKSAMAPAAAPKTNKYMGAPRNGGSRRGNPPRESDVTFAPVASSRRATNTAPRYKRTTQDSMTISHSELVSLVTGSVNFNAVTLAMQPGVTTSFPWLSTQCSGWEKYKWKRLSARYMTRTGTNVPGSLLLVADYDAADPAPNSEIDASSYHGTVDDVPWKENVLHFDMNRSKELFLRNGPLLPNLDVKTYDFANLFICTVDGTAVNWGKVFIDYEIELINAQVVQTGIVGGTIQTAGGGMAVNQIYGATPLVTPGTFIQGCTPAGVITLVNLKPGQEYVLSTFINGTGLTGVTTNGVVGFTIKSNLANDLTNAAGTITMDSATWIANATTGSFTTTALAATTVTNSYTTFAQITNAGTL